jgi:hypothetical protein
MSLNVLHTSPISNGCLNVLHTSENGSSDLSNDIHIYTESESPASPMFKFHTHTMNHGVSKKRHMSEKVICEPSIDVLHRSGASIDVLHRSGASIEDSLSDLRIDDSLQYINTQHNIDPNEIVINEPEQISQKAENILLRSLPDKSNELEDIKSERSTMWKCCNITCNKSLVVYSTQMAILVMVILFSMSQIKNDSGNITVYIALLSSVIGYILPSPKYKSK